jgi:hypothetical protein
MPDENSGAAPPGNPSSEPLPVPQSTQPIPAPIEESIMGKNHQSNSAQKGDDSNDLAREVHWLQHATFWSQIGLAVIGVLALVIYYCQLKATQSAIDLTRTQFTKEQRPYVWQTAKTTSSPTFHVNPKDPTTGQVTWDWHMTNYGKTPANGVSFTQEIKLGNESYALSYGENGKDIGNPQAPGGDTFDTVISRPIKKSDLEKLLTMNDGISIRVIIWYSDADGSIYESGICLSRTNAGSITYCKEANYIH